MLDGIFQAIAEYLFLGIAKIVVPVVTLGKWRVDSKKAREKRDLSLDEWKNGPRYLGENTGMIIGAIIFFIMMIVTAIAISL